MRSIAVFTCVIICLLSACAPAPSVTPTGAPISTSTPTHVLPTASPSSTPLQPLNMKSSLVEIRQRMLISSEYWHSLWIQFEVVEFPLEGSNSMRRADRLQAWLRQPGEALLLLGCMGDCTPTYFLVSDGMRTLEADLGTGVTQQGEVPPSDDESALEQLLPYPVNEMVFPSELILRQGNYTVIGEETYAVIGEEAIEHHPVILVEFTPLPAASTVERLSIDALTGLVLRWEINTTRNGVQKPDCEYTVSRILLEPQFDPGLFTLEIPAALFFQEGAQWTVTHGLETPVR